VEVTVEVVDPAFGRENGKLATFNENQLSAKKQFNQQINYHLVYIPTIQ